MYRRQEANIQHTKVYRYDNYVYNSQDTSKFRPSREKDEIKEVLLILEEISMEQIMKWMKK